MELKITAFYCLCDDFLISKGWRDDPQCAMSTAEVMTAALTAAAFFSGSYERSCVFLEEHGYIPDMLSKSQFSRRLGSIFRRVVEELAAGLQERGGLDLREAFIDGSFVPAKKGALPSAGQNAAKAAGSWQLRTPPALQALRLMK
ncbi:MAG: hypothetical protein ACTFAL_11640 [Candidatus Electronema sp. V4]|uniref:hypothetical protein n=1 Tax=Candidatus Electronema sp. V4 TaxID=3454756 RepID=UPI004055808E